MANIAAYSRHKMLDELNNVLFTNNGDGANPLVYSPAEQRARVQANMGIAVSATGGGAAMFRMPAPATATNTATLTTAQVLNGFLIGTPTAAATYTLPTGALMDAALPNMAVGEAFEFVIRNDGADTFTITLATGTGWTFSPASIVIEPAATPAAGESTHARLWARKTGVATYTLYLVGN